MVFFAPSTRHFNGALVLATAAASSVLLLGSMVDAHGYVSSPLAEFKDGVMPTKYTATMSPAFQGKFNDNPQANVDTFTKAFQGQSEFKTLRDLLKDHGADCGDSKPDASRKAIPGDGKVVWQNPDTGEGFVPSHTGPCEIWLDDKRVFSDENCAGHFTSKPKAELPVDFSSCKENCMLRFYWLALHEPTWQVYKNCVPLIGSGGSNGNGNDSGGNNNGNRGGNNNDKSLNFVSTNAYNSPSETPAASLSPSPSPSSEYGNEYGLPSSKTPSVSPSASPSPSPSPSQGSESSPASDEYGSPSTTPSASPALSPAPSADPAPSPAPSPSTMYAEPQSTPETTQQQQQGHKKCKTHARKLRN